jgi:hypothetical protein
MANDTACNILLLTAFNYVVSLSHAHTHHSSPYQCVRVLLINMHTDVKQGFVHEKFLP